MSIIVGRKISTNVAIYRGKRKVEKATLLYNSRPLQDHKSLDYLWSLDHTCKNKKNPFQSILSFVKSSTFPSAPNQVLSEKSITSFLQINNVHILPF